MRKLAIIVALTFAAAASFADNFSASLNLSGAAVLRQAARERAMGPLGADAQTALERLNSLFDEAKDPIQAEDAIGVFIGRRVFTSEPDAPVAALFIGGALNGGPALGLRMRPRLLIWERPASAWDNLTKEKLKEFVSGSENSPRFTVSRVKASEIAFADDSMQYLLRKKGDYLIVKQVSGGLHSYWYFFKKANVD